MAETSDSFVKADKNKIQSILDRNKNGDSVASIRLAMGTVMNQHLAVFRNEEGMQSALKTIQELKERCVNVPVQDKGSVFNTSIIFALELEFMLDCTEAICLGALSRKESRGAHFRTDMPDRDDVNFLKHTIVTLNQDGPSVDFSPVTITHWQPEVRKY